MSTPGTLDTPDLLEAILAATARIVDVRAAQRPIAEVERAAAAAKPRGEAFRRALARANGVNVIAECKRRSPSRGVLRHDYDPVALASAYEHAGAVAVSVLTEPTFFDGALAHLRAVRGAVSLPVLRKDFVISEYQLLEAREAGADAVLLIVAALEQPRLERLHGEAAALGLAALVEVHEVVELSRAVDAGAVIIGVNNRNLRTLAVDLDASRTLIDRMPQHVVAVAESGLRSRAEVGELRSSGYSAFLVGERLVTSADPATVLRELVDGVASPTPGGQPCA